MDDPRQPPRDTPSDPDGVRVQGRRSGRRLALAALALVLVVGAGAYLVRQAPASTHGAASATRPPGPGPVDAADAAPSTAAAAASPVRRIAPRRQVDADDLASYAVPGMPEPPMGEVIERLHAAGIRTGIGAFNPPGTSPPLSGLAVPEGFALPPGYVRHYQATDAGERIEPILMFSPDFEFLDARGNPIPLPANRVVPPHLAPPGLPLRTVRIPPPRDGGP